MNSTRWTAPVIARLARRAESALRWLALVPAAALFAIAVERQPTVPSALLAAYFGVAFLAMAHRDLKERIIPNRLAYPSLVVAVVLSPLCPGRGPLEALAGALVAAAPVGAVYGVTRGGMGAGDLKMAALVGAVVGYPAALGALAVASLTGGVAALGLLAIGGSRRTTMPYALFLSIGAAAVLSLR